MSRVGFKKIEIPHGVEVMIDSEKVHVKGPKGELSQGLRPEVSVLIEDGHIRVSRSSDRPGVRSLHGLIRSELSNLIQGVSRGFEKILDINGVGYRAALEGGFLVLSLGHSHPIRYELPSGIDVVLEKQTTVIVKGSNKYLVGEVAAKIRSFRPPEPYKGKGVKYRDERIIRKEGKKGK